MCSIKEHKKIKYFYILFLIYLLFTSRNCYYLTPYIRMVGHSFPHYRMKKRYFREKFIERKMCVLTFSTTFDDTFLILRRTERDIIININRFSCKVPVILIRFQRNEVSR